MESRTESVEDMTAALMAPIPNTDTQYGVKFCRASGSTFPASPRSNGGGRPYCVWFQSEKINFNMSVSHTQRTSRGQYTDKMHDFIIDLMMTTIRKQRLSFFNSVRS